MKHTIDEVERAYQTCPEFREYVEKYAEKMNISKFEALSHITVAEVMEYYKNKPVSIPADGIEKRSCDAR